MERLFMRAAAPSTHHGPWIRGYVVMQEEWTKFRELPPFL